MNDMSPAIVPKTDQLNGDSLIAGPITVTITGVDIRSGTEQPVSIHYQGGEGKPWKPCKSMCRVLVAAWGADAKAYVGRSVTLYRDPAVKWAGMEVGGIRISHLSNIDASLTMALTATRGSKKLHTVKQLAAPVQQQTGLTAEEVEVHLDAMANAADLEHLKVAFNTAWMRCKQMNDEAAKPTLKGFYDTRKKELEVMS